MSVPFPRAFSGEAKASAGKAQEAPRQSGSFRSFHKQGLHKACFFLGRQTVYRVYCLLCEIFDRYIFTICLRKCWKKDSTRVLYFPARLFISQIRRKWIL